MRLYWCGGVRVLAATYGKEVEPVWRGEREEELVQRCAGEVEPVWMCRKEDKPAEHLCCLNSMYMNMKSALLSL